MIVQKSSVFPAGRDAVFQRLRQLETLQYIARPYAAFEPVDPGQTTWEAGSTSACRFRLFGVIPPYTPPVDTPPDTPPSTPTETPPGPPPEIPAETPPTTPDVPAAPADTQPVTPVESVPDVHPDTPRTGDETHTSLYLWTMSSLA